MLLYICMYVIKFSAKWFKAKPKAKGTVLGAYVFLGAIPFPDYPWTLAELAFYALNDNT